MVKENLPSWVHPDSDEGLVHVNVGGLKRSLCSSTLKKFPDTRLGKLLACDSEEDILQVGYGWREMKGLTDSLFSHLLVFPAAPLPPLCRCVMTTTCRRRSFTLTGIPACFLMSFTSTRRANFTSWRSCASSPSGLYSLCQSNTAFLIFPQIHLKHVNISFDYI